MKHLVNVLALVSGSIVAGRGQSEVELVDWFPKEGSHFVHSEALLDTVWYIARHAPTELNPTYVSLNGEPLNIEYGTNSRLDENGLRRYGFYAETLFPVNEMGTIKFEVPSIDGSRTETRTVEFDAFSINAPIIELEAYDHSGGQTEESPRDYAGRSGTFEQDYFTTGSAENTFRPGDAIGIVDSEDYPRAHPWYDVFDEESQSHVIFDKALIELQEGDWTQYTVAIPSGLYLPYLRQRGNGGQRSELSVVEPNEQVRSLGVFAAESTGAQYKSIPLTVNEEVAEGLFLSGVQRFRLTQERTVEGAMQNYIVFVPQDMPVLQEAEAVTGPWESAEIIHYEVDTATFTMNAGDEMGYFRVLGQSDAVFRIDGIELDGEIIQLSIEGNPVPNPVELPNGGDN